MYFLINKKLLRMPTRAADMEYNSHYSNLLGFRHLSLTISRITTAIKYMFRFQVKFYRIYIFFVFNDFVPTAVAINRAKNASVCLIKKSVSRNTAFLRCLCNIACKAD